MPAGGRSAGGASENAVGVESRNRHRRPPRRRRAWLSPSAPPAAPVRTASSLRTTARSAWGHAAVSAGAFAGRIAPLRVHDARATVRRSRTRRSRESASCSRFGPASQGIAMKPAAFDYQAPGTLREAIDLLASNPGSVPHRRGTKPDAGSRLPPGDPEPAGRSAAATRARQYRRRR
jgi:hypothetical protein